MYHGILYDTIVVAIPERSLCSWVETGTTLDWILKPETLVLEAFPQSRSAHRYRTGSG